MATQTTYTYAQLEGLWDQAGGNPSLAPLMAAIAEAESGGNPQAYNPSGASGLWQIMMPVNAQYVPGGQANVFNPEANAAAAVAVYNAQGPSAWTTYTSGAYQAYMSNSTTPDTATLASSLGSAAQEAASSCVLSSPSFLGIGGGCLLSKSEVRALLGGLLMGAGAILFLAGVVIVVAEGFERTSAGRTASAVARKIPGI